MEATVVDQLLPGLPLAPKPTPHVAAALSPGYLPCLERLLRLTQRSADDGAIGEACRATVLLEPLAGWPLLLQLMAYDDVRQVAALVVTTGKLVGRQARGGSLGKASGRALEQVERLGNGEPLLREPTCVPNGLLCAMYMQLIYRELLPGWHWDKQLRRWQGSGRETGAAGASSSSSSGTAGGGGDSNSGSSSGGSGSSDTGAGASGGGPFTSTAAAGAAGAPQLPPLTRQALRLLSLAIVRWTTACLHNVNWAVEQGAGPDDAAASATAAMDVLSNMNLCLCARALAAARGTHVPARTGGVCWCTAWACRAA